MANTTSPKPSAAIGTTIPGPRKQAVHGGAELTQRGNVAKRLDAGFSTKATPPTREPNGVPLVGPRSPAAAKNGAKR